MSETNASTALETKLFQLQLTTKRTDGILAKSEEEPIARHQGTLRTVIGEVENLRLTVEAEKLGRKEDTTEWSEEIDTKISEADSHVRLTKEWLAENKRKLEEMENDEKIKFERLNPRNCVYCDSGEHKTNDCAKVTLTSALVTGSDPVPPPVVTGSDSIPPPVVTGSDSIPPPVVTGSDPIPPPVVTGSDPIPPPVVTGSDPIPPPVVTGSDPIPPPVVTGSDPIPPPVVTGSDPIPPPVVTGSDPSSTPHCERK
ncbi:Hypothetical predicted protein [Paramuricea clavata]|uniref:Uncharacterized protein n=1 Tax=Paramuricea clavata TaxID=317549 RepID=A0A7D9HA91_PARCT|nr:Hypothetical predicted protein [Paramuricea clavata]